MTEGYYPDAKIQGLIRAELRPDGQIYWRNNEVGLIIDSQGKKAGIVLADDRRLAVVFPGGAVLGYDKQDGRPFFGFTFETRYLEAAEK